MFDDPDDNYKYNELGRKSWWLSAKTMVQGNRLITCLHLNRFCVCLFIHQYDNSDMGSIRFWN